MNLRRAHGALRIASVPHDQIYIRHLESWEGTGTPPVVRLPDPPPEVPGSSVQSPWWPPAMLSARWIRKNHHAFDLMHIHFGFDATTPTQLHELIGELRRFGKPLVYTVHDLINPHQADPAAHRQLLDVLIPAADKLITLTAGAAEEIRSRWGVHADVLPHPHVVDFESMDRIRTLRSRDIAMSVAADPRRIGVHFKSLRPNMDYGILDPLARVSARLPNLVLQVNIHAQLLHAAHKEYRPALATRLLAGAESGLWDLVAHEYFSEPELFAYLASLDVCVLPYRFGTHSGWLEAALDVGTHVTAPNCGYYADQHPSITKFGLTSTGVDEQSLQVAIEGLLESPALPGLDAKGRREQRAEIADAHQGIYETLLSRGPHMPL